LGPFPPGRRRGWRCRILLRAGCWGSWLPQPG